MYRTRGSVKLKAFTPRLVNRLHVFLIFFLPFFKFFTILNAGISRNHLKVEEGNVYFHNNNQAVMNKVFGQDFLMVIPMISMYSKKM